MLSTARDFFKRTPLLFLEPFPPIVSTPSVSAEVEKIGSSEVLDFKCRFGQLENNTSAMYKVSWFNSTSLLRAEVINGSFPGEIHATLPEMHALGFRLGDIVSSFTGDLK